MKHFPKILLTALALGTLMIATTGLICCSEGIVRSFVYMPTNPRDKDEYLTNHQHWEPYRRTFDCHGEKLSGWLLNKADKPLLVFYGGNAMDVSNLLPYFSTLPYSVLAVNYRGYGLSTGSPTEQHLISDACTILDQVLKETGHKASQVVLVGISLGSGVATQVAAARPVGNLVLLVPFDSLLATAKDMVPGYVPVDFLLPDTFRSDLFASKVHCPVTILAAGRDEVIHPSHARKLATCFPSPPEYIEFPDSLHNNIWFSDGFDKAFRNALNKVNR